MGVGTMSEAWILRDTNRDTERELNSRSEAEDAREDLIGIGATRSDLEIIPPGETEDEPLPGVDECVHCGQEIDDGWCPDCDEDNGGDEIVVDSDTKEGDGRQPELDDRGKPQMPEAEVEPITEDEMADLPERNVSDDPLTWMPQHFVDQIDGTPAINRKGFEVLAHHYNISTTSELEVPPEETGHEYVRVKARAVTEDGRECEAYGSAHVDRGDDKSLLLEMADTRARKRALSVATGVGTIAVEELRNEVDNG